jgi:hypothetical protein
MPRLRIIAQAIKPHLFLGMSCQPHIRVMRLEDVIVECSAIRRRLTFTDTPGRSGFNPQQRRAVVPVGISLQPVEKSQQLLCSVFQPQSLLIMTPVADTPARQQTRQGNHHQQFYQRHAALAIGVKLHLVVHGGQCNQARNRVKGSFSALKHIAQAFYATGKRAQQNAMQSAVRERQKKIRAQPVRPRG